MSLGPNVSKAAPTEFTRRARRRATIWDCVAVSTAHTPPGIAACKGGGRDRGDGGAIRRPEVSAYYFTRRLPTPKIAN